jgi:hypothetical protein
LAEDKKTEVKSESDPKEEVDESKTYADQDDFNPNTIFGDATKDMDHGGYGAVTMSYGKLLDYDVTFAGGRGGWVLDHKYIIGGGGYGLGTEIDVEDGDDTKKLDVDYGGAAASYLFAYLHLFYSFHGTRPVAKSLIETADSSISSNAPQGACCKRFENFR